MKRFLAVNNNFTAIAVSRNFGDCVDIVEDDTKEGDIIFEFDIDNNICYAYEKVGNGYTLAEGPTPFMEFGEFTSGHTPIELYRLIISKII